VRLVVDLARCVGHARCEALAKAVYTTDAVEGKVVLIASDVPKELEAIALRGARACPERAIAVMGDEDSGLLWPPRRFTEETR
jgi:ferredoxin